MQGKNIFCILAKTGAGKNVYINNILKDENFLKNVDLSLLAYGTTRPPRKGEVNGIDYYFYSKEEYDKIPRKDIVETRSYYTMNDGEIYYFTKSDYFINSNTKNILCIASPYQYEHYRNWCANENIRGNNYKLFLIMINTDLKIRLNRVINKRAVKDDDIYEVCRRVIQEKMEFEDVSARVPELKDSMSYSSACIIDNNFEDNNIDKSLNLLSIETKNNIDKIKDFIRRNS